MHKHSRIAFQFPHDRGAPGDELLSYATLADELGYDTVFVPESWNRDAFTTLGVIAARTKNVRLGPGIVNVFSRTPALIAQSIATLDEASGGRAVLGLGISGPAVIENWHGVPFESALRRTREVVEIVRMALGGGRVDYPGELFRLKGFRLGFQPARTEVPIFIASIGPKNNRLTGEIADGWLPIWLPLEGFASALEEVGQVGEVAPNIMACVGEDKPALRDKVRPHLGYYVGGMGTFYRNVVARFGFRNEAERVHRLWQDGRRREAVSAVSDAMIDQLAALGSPEECRQRLDEFRTAGATLPVVVVPLSASRAEIERTLEELR